VWDAITTEDFTRKYWFGYQLQSDWKVDSPWRIANDDGRVMDQGVVLAAEPPRLLKLRWRNEWSPEINAEGDSICTISVEPQDAAVKLTVVHEIDRGESKLVEAVSGGWPRILSNLKSLLETGELAITHKPKP
jgi:uncharacterized protein YndB with AHSA1/START domain